MCVCTHVWVHMYVHGSLVSFLRCYPLCLKRGLSLAWGCHSSLGCEFWDGWRVLRYVEQTLYPLSHWPRHPSKPFQWVWIPFGFSAFEALKMGFLQQLVLKTGQDFSVSPLLNCGNGTVVLATMNVWAAYLALFTKKLSDSTGSHFLTVPTALRISTSPDTPRESWGTRPCPEALEQVSNSNISNLLTFDLLSLSPPALPSAVSVVW